MVINKQLTNKFMNDLKVQDRVDSLSGRTYNPLDRTEQHMKLECMDEESLKKLTMYREEDCLIDMIHFYQHIYSLEEDDEVLRDYLKENKTDKNALLLRIKKGYKNQLNNLKFLGADVSDYPKLLDKLTE